MKKNNQSLKRPTQKYHTSLSPDLVSQQAESDSAARVDFDWKVISQSIQPIWEEMGGFLKKIDIVKASNKEMRNKQVDLTTRIDLLRENINQIRQQKDQENELTEKKIIEEKKTQDRITNNILELQVIKERMANFHAELNFVKKTQKNAEKANEE